MARGNATHIELDTKVLDAMLKHVGSNAGVVVVEAAGEVRDEAKKRAPVFTGGLRESIYVRANQGGDSFSGVSSAVRSRWSRVSATMPSYQKARLIELPKPENDQTAYVGASASYSVAVEFGSARRAARSYFWPAVRAVERKLASKFGKAITDKKLR